MGTYTKRRLILSCQNKLLKLVFHVLILSSIIIPLPPYFLVFEYHLVNISTIILTFNLSSWFSHNFPYYSIFYIGSPSPLFLFVLVLDPHLVVFRGYSWFLGSRDHIGCWGSTTGWPNEGQMPYYCAIS